MLKINCKFNRVSTSVKGIVISLPILLVTGCTTSLVDDTFVETMQDFTYCYDIKDEWKSPELTLATCGDCEDFAILLRQRLLDRGVSEGRMALVSGKLANGHSGFQFFVGDDNQNSLRWKNTSLSNSRHMTLRVDDYYYDQNGFQWDFPELGEKKAVQMKSYLHGGIYYREPVNSALVDDRMVSGFTAQ